MPVTGSGTETLTRVLSTVSIIIIIISDCEGTELEINLKTSLHCRLSINSSYAMCDPSVAHYPSLLPFLITLKMVL